MMVFDKFFIRSDYIANKKSLSNDIKSGGSYWTTERKDAAGIYQFPAYRYAAKIIRAKGLSSVTDIGCGPAVKLQWIHFQQPNLRITGIDQPEPIEYCRETYNFGAWVEADFDILPVAENTVKSELVICCDVIEHIENPDILLEYLKACVTANGYIVISTPERDRLRGKNCLQSPNRFHMREWNLNEFRTYLENRGFEVMRHFFQLPVKLCWHRIVWQEVLRHFFSGKALKYNQVCLLRVK